MTKAKITYYNEDKLIQEERERLRKLRLIQVREISKQNAANLREAFRQEKEKEIKKLIFKQEQTKKKEIEENFNEIKEIVQKEIDCIGQGHLSAANYDDKSDLRQKQAIENEEKALIRGRTALIVEKEEKILLENKENAHIISRKNAIEQEKIRSAKIAKLPKPVDDLDKVVNKKPTKLVSFHDVDVFTTTRYHMPETVVDKATKEETNDTDARKNAENEELRQKSLEKELQRQNNERMEKARLRGKHALEKEILNENYNDILNELNMLQQADREKRQKELINIPKEIFLPSWQREQEKNELQLELERQFEKIYIDENMRKEDMPQPVETKLDVSKSDNLQEDSELDLTVLNEDQNQTQIEVKKQPEEVVTKKDQEIQVTISKTPEIPTQNETKNQSENLVLNKLLEKIKKQREEIAQKSSQVDYDSTLDDSVQTIASEANKLEQSVKKSEAKCDNESDKIETGLIEDETVQDEIEDEEEDLSYTLSLNSNTPKSVNEQSQDKKNLELNKKEKKIIRGIMMSSHNVSSINELVLDHRVSSQKITSTNNRAKKIDSFNLSHASRDQMIAGPKELFNKNDFKIAIELKQKELQKQQEELEEKLKQLEEQQTRLEQEAKQKNLSTNESVNNSSLTLSHSIESKNNSNSLLNEDDLKRIEFQKYLLSSNKNEKETDTALLIEDRKKEIKKKFGLQSPSSTSLNEVTNKKPPISVPSSQIHHDDKTTIYSADSGFVSSSNHFNLNLRNSAQNHKKPINLEVEQLNKEIMQNHSKSYLTLKQQQLLKQNEFLNYLNGDINENEYKRRLSCISTTSSGSISNSFFTNEQISKLFGLEFYDSNNMTEIRDLSVEQLIGLNLQQQLIQQQLKQQQEPKSKSSGLYTKTNSSSASSDDTLNDQEDSVQDSFHDISKLKKKLEDKSSESEEEEEDDKNLIFEMLNKNKNLNPIDLKKQFIQDQFDMVRRQKDQLELEKKQTKAFSHTSLPNNLPPPIKINKFLNELNLHELSTIKEVDTPISERNLKLNTINNYSRQQYNANNNINRSSINLTTVSSMDSTLENVTQLSESNVPLNNNKTSLNTQLIDLAQQNVNNNSNNIDKTLSDCNLSSQNKNTNSSSSFTSTSTPINGSALLAQTQQTSSQQLLNLELLRQKQKQFLNISLFDSSNTSSDQSSSHGSPINQANNFKKVEYGELIFDSLLTNNLSISALAQQTHNQTSLQTTNLQKPLAFKSESTISTESFTINKNLNNNNNNNNNSNSFNFSSNKKWFDILASSTDDEEKSLKEKSLISNLSCGPLQDSSLNKKNIEAVLNETSSSTNSFLNSLAASESNKSSLLSVSPSVLINDSYSSIKYSNKPKDNIKNDSSLKDLEPICNKNNTCFKMTNLTADMSSNFTTTSGVGSDSTKNKNENTSGLFDRFLKSYSTTTATQSVMDEPEISFVSYKTNSNPPSPRSKTYQTIDNKSNCTSESSNYSNLSLIQIQQKQLSKQFANVSPIDAFTNSSCQSQNFLKSLSNTIPFETTESVTRSVINNQSTSLIEGRLDENDSISESLIEDRLTVPYDMTSISQFNNFYNLKLEKKALNSFNNKNVSKQTYQFTNVTSLNSSRKSDSLISFENHELSQMTPTPINKQKSSSSLISKPINHFDFLDQDDSDESDTTMLSLKQISNTTKFTNQQNSPMCNSTPMATLNSIKNSFPNEFKFDNLSDQSNSLIYFNNSSSTNSSFAQN